MGVPMYMRIQQYIRRQIESGEWQPDAPVPTEAELMDRFNVSRITVTTALRELVKEGLIYRIQGKGTYVAEQQKKNPNIFDIADMISFADSLEFTILPGDHRPAGTELTYPEKEIADILHLDENQKVYIVNRVKYTNEIPIVAERVYYPDYIFSGISSEHLETEHISALLGELGIDAGQSVSYIEPVLCEPDIAELLKLREGSPVIKISLEVYDKKNNPLALVELYNYGKQKHIANRNPV